MSEWIVYSKDGITEKCTIKSLEYSGSWMGECYITATIKSATPLSFSIGDYLEYRGERFEINYDPSVIKSATSGTYGEGFTYDNVKFNSLSDELTRCDFLDYVPEDNLIHYSSLPNFSFFADTIEKLAERIQVNLDRVYTGEKKWTIEVYPEYVNKTNVNIVVSNMTCWDALALVKSQFNANFVIKNRTITIGTEGIAVDNIFSYGKGNGLVTIERNAETDQKIVTRLRAYGSTRNLPMRYYFNNGEGIVPNNMAVQNLMLPSFPKETLDPYVDSENISELGIREATIFFDGSGEFEEIYPSMEGMTAEDLISAGIQVSATGRLDEVVGAEQITDNGIFEPTEEEPEINIPTFTITLKDVGFDINDHLSAAGSATISMKDGMCGGREFEIVECKKEGNNYILTCNRAEDTSLGLYFPYNDYNIKAGDKFVLLNIEMPDVYIQAASQRLLTAAKEYLSKNDYVRYSYTPKVDNIYMARQHDTATSNGQKSIHDTIKEGDLMLFEDNDLLIEGSVIIDTLSIKEGEGIPEYEITLRNDKTVGTIEKIQNQIDSIVSGSTAVGGSGGYNASQIKSLIKTFGSTFFLRKDQPDTAREVITFEKGLNVGEFVTGASGASFFKDLATGQTIMELDKLYVRMKAFFETLTIVEAQTISGKQIISPAGSVRCTNVEEYDDYYRCYFLNEQDGEKIENKFIVGDQVYSQMFNAKTGTSNKISNRYYWRLVTGVGENYIDLSKTDCDADSDAPMVGDILNQRGHRYPENSERMNFIETSTVDGFSPSITLFHGVNSFSLVGKDYVQFGVDKSTNKAFMNVYGDMYVGDRNKTAYMRYTQEEGLVICGKLDVGTKLGDSYLKDLISASTPEGYQEFVEKVTQDLEGLQAQIDGTIDSYFFQYEPSLDNYPASEWDTEIEKQAHLNDTFTNLVDGRSWRWSLDGTYKWVEITDTATTKALALAGKAQDTADGKRRVFVDTPYPPYDKGDLWSRGSNFPLMICVVPKESGVYAEGDFDYADNNVKLKEEMQTLVTETKSELNNSIGQAKEAANKYTDEGITSAKEDINAIIDELEKAKANVTEVYSKAEADGKITEAETSAINAAKAQADAAIALSETTIKAYADGIVDDEEAARIKQAQENLAEAKEYAEEQAQAAKSEIENSYLFQALQDAQSTEIANGLVLTSLIQLRDTQSNIMSGINGLINASKGDKSIATWWGGDMLDLIDYYRWDGTQWVVKSGITAPSNIPSGLIRMDGTGYLAKGKFWWDNDGKIYADPTALFLSFDVENEGASLSATILDIRDKQTEFANMWSIETDSNGTKYLYSKYPLVSQGGVTMYAGTSGLDVEGIYDGLPIDGSTIYWENGILKAVGGGGVADSVAWSDITGKPSFATVATSGSYNDLLNKPTLLSSFTNDVGFITNDIDGSMRIGSTVYVSDSDTVYGVELYGTDEVGVIGVHSYGAWKCANISLYPNGYTTLHGNTTVNGNLIISTGADSKLVLDNTDNDTKYQCISFRQNGTEYGSLGTSYDNNLLWNQAYVLTSGNYTSYTYSKSTIDSKLSGYLPLSGGTINNTSTSDILRLKTTIDNNPRILILGSSGNVLTALGKWDDYTYLTNFKSGTQGWELRLFDNNTIQFGYGATNYPILHSGNYTSYTYSKSTIDSKLSGYLPLTGGTINGFIYFNDKKKYIRHTGGSSGYLEFFNETSTFSGLGLWDNGAVKVYTNAKWNDIIHSGNYSSYALPLTGGTLTGKLTINTSSYGGQLEIYRNQDNGNSVIRFSNSEKVLGDIGICGSGGEYPYQLYFADRTTNITSKIYHSGNLTKLSQLTNDSGFITSSASISGNAASSTKLQTARTIWGQSFDGTGNVSGNFLTTRDIFTNSGKEGIYMHGFGIDWHNSSNEFTENLLKFTSSGNIAVGNVNPQYKLHVNGTLNATTIYQNGSTLDSLLGAKLNSSSYTAADVLAKLKTVDGSGSGLDADMLDGCQLASFMTFLSRTNYVKATLNDSALSTLATGDGYIEFWDSRANGWMNSQWGNITALNITARTAFIGNLTGNASSASKLNDNSNYTAWGQTFFSGGTPNSVSGNMTGVGSITASGNITTSGSLVTNGARVEANGSNGSAIGLFATGTTYSLGFIIGDGGVNRGIYDYTNGSWMLYRDSSEDVYIPYGNLRLGSTAYIGGDANISGNANVSGYVKCGSAVFLQNGTYAELSSGGNEMILSGSANMYVNYRSSAYGRSVPSSWVWNAGSGGSYASFTIGGLTANGNILATGGITMYSQRSLKNVMDERGLSLDELRVIKPTRYTWKDGRDERLHIGGIADDIQQVLPEVVYRTPDGVLTMDYGNAAFAIASSLIKPMIEHESEIVSLKRRVRELEEEVKRLRA